MAIYKPSLLDKFKDFVNGLRANWDDYETHKADYAALLAGGTEYTATLENGWTGTLKYKKNKLGQVHLFGEIYAGETTRGTTITVLPSAYRPPYVTAIPAQSSGINIGGLVGFAVTTSGNFNIYGEAPDKVSTFPVRINAIYQT